MHFLHCLSQQFEYLVFIVILFYVLNTRINNVEFLLKIKNNDKVFYNEQLECQRKDIQRDKFNTFMNINT